MAAAGAAVWQPVRRRQQADAELARTAKGGRLGAQLVVIVVRIPQLHGHDDAPDASNLRMARRWAGGWLAAGGGVQKTRDKSGIVAGGPGTTTPLHHTCGLIPQSRNAGQPLGAQATRKLKRTRAAVQALHCTRHLSA